MFFFPAIFAATVLRWTNPFLSFASTFAPPETPQLSRLSLLFTSWHRRDPRPIFHPSLFDQVPRHPYPHEVLSFFLEMALECLWVVVVKWSGSGVKKRKMMVLYTIYIFSEISSCHGCLTKIDHSSHKTCPQGYPLSCSKLSLVAELTLVGSLPRVFRLWDHAHGCCHSVGCHVSVAWRFDLGLVIDPGPWWVDW